MLNDNVGETDVNIDELLRQSKIDEQANHKEASEKLHEGMKVEDPVPEIEEDTGSYTFTEKVLKEQYSKEAMTTIERRMLMSMSDPTTTVATNCNWLIDERIIQHGMTVMYGAAGTRKSFIALDISLRIAAADHFDFKYSDGSDIHSRGHVVYFAAEGQTFAKERVAAFMLDHGITEDYLSNYFTLIEMPPFLNDPEYIKAIKGSLEKLEKHKTQPVIVMVFDTFQKCTRGISESNNDEVSDIYARLQEFIDLRKKMTGTECSAIVVHHERKPSESGYDAGPRGAAAHEDAVDIVIRVQKCKGNPSRSKLSFRKLRIKEDGDEIEYSFKNVQIAIDDAGKPKISTCVETAVATTPIEPLSNIGKPTKALKPLGRQQQRHFEMMREIEINGRKTTRALLRQELDNNPVNPGDTPSVAHKDCDGSLNSFVNNGRVFIQLGDDGTEYFIIRGGTIDRASQGNDDS